MNVSTQKRKKSRNSQQSEVQQNDEIMIPMSDTIAEEPLTRDHDDKESGENEEHNSGDELENTERSLPEKEGNTGTAEETTSTSSSGRVRRRTQRFQESVEQVLAITSFKATETEADDEYYDVLHEDDYRLQDDMKDPIAFKASSDPDILYYHEAIRAADSKEFLKAIVKEVNDHIEGNHWELIPTEEVPKGTRVLDSVWAMKRKRDIKTRQVYKHKARLNIHGGQQEYGTHYTDTYSPVVNWFSVRLLLVLSKIHGYKTRQVDFVLAYPQADIPYDNYMKLPHGIKTVQGNGNTHVLKLKKNIYGGKNSGRVWNDYLKGGLVNIGFKQSAIDECVFYRKDVIFFFYVDDGIFIAKSNRSIDKAISDLSDVKKAKAKYKIDDQGDITDYLGINFDEIKDDSPQETTSSNSSGRVRSQRRRICMSQPHLIDQIIQEVGIKPREKGKTTPAASTKILRRCKEDPSVKCHFNYRRVIGKLNYLEKSSRPDISYAVHQCARFCEDPKQGHIDAVIHLAKYLRETRDKGMILDPTKTKSFEVWVDADFSGNWSKSTAENDPSTAKSRSGYVITYGGCPIIWVSKLQTQIALSSCEAEYISLSQSLRDAIPIMRMLQELKDRGFNDEYLKPEVRCKAFEDNTGALTLATVPKMRPRTKHINLVYHHFREAVRDGLVTIISVGTKDQVGDMFTKPLPQNDFVKFRKLLMGW